jgi:hypothetical protein
VAAVSAPLVLTACSGDVAVNDPTPTGADQSTCTALMSALPTQVLGQQQRHVRPGVFSAAWGDPAITLRCGVAKPQALTAASECLEVNGVGWFSEQAQHGVLFTTIGRRTFIEVAVPEKYAPETGALPDLADVVTRHDAVLQPCV